MRFSIDWQHSWYTKVIVAGCILFIVFLFWPRGSAQVNKPCLAGVALPGSTVTADLRSSQVQLCDRPFEVGVGAIAGRFDNRDFYAGGVLFKYKF